MRSWIIVNQEFDTPYVDKHSIVYLDLDKAMNALREVNMLPENRQRLHFNDHNAIRPDNAYGLHYPYNIKEIEVI